MGAIRHISRQGGGSGGSGGGVDFRTGGLYVDVFMVIFLADVLWVYSLLEVGNNNYMVIWFIKWVIRRCSLGLFTTGGMYVLYVL